MNLLKIHRKAKHNGIEKAQTATIEFRVVTNETAPIY